MTNAPALAAEFERNESIIDSTRSCRRSWVPAGVLTDRRPSDQEWADLRYGYVAARHVGKLDAGRVRTGRWRSHRD